MGRLKNRASRFIDMPVSSFGECPYIELEGNHAVKITSSCEILSYDSEKIVLRLRGMTLSVIGEGISISSYGGDTVRLNGSVSELMISDVKGELC